MSFLAFCVFAVFVGMLLLIGWLEDYNHRAYQRDMRRQFQAFMEEHLDKVTGEWKPDPTPTDWACLAGLGPKGGRAKERY